MGSRAQGMGSGAMWSMLDNLAQQALSFLVFLLLARIIAPQDFGLIAIAHVMVTFVRQTVFDAIVQPVARAQSPSDALYSRAFAICIVAALLISMLVLAGAGMVSRLYALPELVQVLSWMSVVVMATGTAAVYESRLARRLEFKPLAIRSIVSVLIGGCIGIALALRGAGVMALVAQQVATSCIALALLVVQSRWRPHFAWRELAVRQFLPDASRVGMTGLFGFLANQGDTILVSILMGSYATGIYSFAKRLTSAIYLVIGSSLLKLAIPAFANAGDNPAALRGAYVRILGTSVFLMAPMLAGLSVLAYPVISLFFGNVWAPAAPIVSLLSVLYLLLAANQVNDYLLFAVGAHSAPMKRSMLQILLALLLGAMSASLGLGLEWTAAAFVLAGATVWPWAQWLSNRYMHFGFIKLANALMSPIVATTTMTLVLMLTIRNMDFTVVRLLEVVVLGVAVFFFSHVLVIKISPTSHNALHDLFKLKKPTPR